LETGAEGEGGGDGTQDKAESGGQEQGAPKKRGNELELRTGMAVI
jgi:hypothetical protein